MKISVNKDFEKEYRDDMWKGFTARQICYLAAAFAASAGTVGLLYVYLQIPLQICIYASILVVLPVIALGFWTYQDMPAYTVFQAYRLYQKTRFLYWIPNEQIHEIPSSDPILLEKEWNRKKRQVIRYRKKMKRKGKQP